MVGVVPLQDGAAAPSAAVPAQAAAAALVADDWVQCDRCAKWRRVPEAVAESLDDDAPWFCEDNPDARFASCAVAQVRLCTLQPLPALHMLCDHMTQLPCFSVATIVSACCTLCHREMPTHDSPKPIPITGACPSHSAITALHIMK